MRMRRPKKEVSRKIEDKLLQSMRTNYDRLVNGGEPRNVKEILNEMNRSLGMKLTRRALSKRLRIYYDKGILKRKKIGRNVFYYMRHFPPSLFWSRILKPFIDEMKITTSGVSSGLLLIGNENYFITLSKRAAILQQGMDILPSEDPPRDVFGEILAWIEEIVSREIRLRLQPEHFPSDGQIETLKQEFAGKKLALIYILDGSSLDVWDKEKMGSWGASPNVLSEKKREDAPKKRS